MSMCYISAYHTAIRYNMHSTKVLTVLCRYNQASAVHVKLYGIAGNRLNCSLGIKDGAGSTSCTTPTFDELLPLKQLHLQTYRVQLLHRSQLWNILQNKSKGLKLLAQNLLVLLVVLEPHLRSAAQCSTPLQTQNHNNADRMRHIKSKSWTSRVTKACSKRSKIVNVLHWTVACQRDSKEAHDCS